MTTLTPFPAVTFSNPVQQHRFPLARKPVSISASNLHAVKRTTRDIPDARRRFGRKTFFQMYRLYFESQHIFR
jgi:hypothetical protein